MKRKLRLLNHLPETAEYYGWKRYEVVGNEEVVVTKYRKGEKQFKIVSLVDSWQAFPDIAFAIEAKHFPAASRGGLRRNPDTGLLELQIGRAHV